MEHIIETVVDLDKPYAASTWQGLVGNGDDASHRLRVKTIRDGQPIPLESVAVYLYVTRQDGSTILLKGSVNGDWAEAILSRACYELPGTLTATVVIQAADGSVLSAARVHLLVKPL